MFQLQTVVYSHLLTIVAPRSLAPHEHPTSRQSKLFRSDPQALLRHLSRRANEINNALYDFVHMPMHGPGWEHKLKHILEVRTQKANRHWQLTQTQLLSSMIRDAAADPFECLLSLLISCCAPTRLCSASICTR